MTSHTVLKNRALLTCARAIGLLILSGAVASTNVVHSASILEPLARSRPVAAGAAHSLAIDLDGKVWAWGQNLTGQLGTGDILPRRVPVRVSGLTGTFVAVSAGVAHSLALRDDGAVFAWGLNLEGQLGIGSHVTRLTPARITSLSDVVGIAAGGGHSLAVKSDGTVWAFGGNLLGQIGDGSTSARRTPVAVATIGDIVAVEAGLTHSLALRYDGTVFAWGGNTGGQLGDGTTTLRRRPITVLNVSNAVSMTAGAAHSLAVTNDGALWAWGANSTSQLGDGTTTGRRTPILLSDIPPIAFASAGGAHSVAITTSGTALGWGDNSSGQVGDGTTTRASRPVDVLQPPSSISAIAAGAAHTVAFGDSDVSAWTWGNNLLSQLGDGTNTRRTAPSPISGPAVAWGVYPPIFSPAGGTFPGEVSVSLSTPTPNAVIRYSLDGSDPTANHPLYTDPIEVTEETTIKARAFRSGLAPSQVSTATYTIGGGGPVGGLATPVATSTGGPFTQARSVTLTADAGTEIRYTLNGSEPSESSVLFEGPIVIASTTTLRARAFKAGETPSGVLTVRYVIEGVPAGETPTADPATNAPATSDNSLTAFADGAAFLFGGADPVQRGGDVTQIARERFAVVRGRVLMRDGQPLVGVRVRAIEQPAVGYTISRSDGGFDLAVNGGGPVTLEYTRSGFLPAQRRVDVSRQDFAAASDVRLVQLDPVATDVSFEPHGVAVAARGSVMTDNSGTRQATLIVPEGGVMATIHLPDGTVMPGVSRLSVRATEYTVGLGGPESMPATLPSTSGYTYAVELTADEALQAGATTVTFDPPLALYVENFLGFPAGGIVPLGYFDRARSSWIPSDDGRVIAVLGVNGAGEAELDVDGDGEANPAVDEVVCEPDGDGGQECEPVEGESLADLGITSGERKRLAQLYAPGQSVWRSPIPHFTPWDANWPVQPPSDAQPPNLTQPPTDQTGQRPGGDAQTENPTPACGSVIECENQTLGESLPIAGTPFSLSYRSDRVPGYVRGRSFTIPLTGSTVPASAKRVGLEIKIGGQKYTSEYGTNPGQSLRFTWNGLDGYGRPMNGQQIATATVTHYYDALYSQPQRDFDLRSFARPPLTGLGNIIGDRVRGELGFEQPMRFGVETGRGGLAAVGGWYISAQHRYDSRSRTLFMGDGGRRTASATGMAIGTVVGGGETPVESTPVPVREALLTHTATAVTEAADGSVYVTDVDGIVRVRDGMATRVVPRDATMTIMPQLAARGDLVVYAYGEASGSCGEGGRIAVAHAYRLTPEGPAEALAAIPIPSAGGCDSALPAIATDGSIYVAAARNVWLVRSGQPTVAATLDARIFSITPAPDGGLYLGTTGGGDSSARVRLWRPDGSLRPIAGSGGPGNGGDGGPAVDAQIGFPRALATNAAGDLLIMDSEAGVLRIVRNGIIQHLAGNPEDFTSDETLDGPSGRQARLIDVRGIAVGQDGRVYLTTNSQTPVVRTLAFPFDDTRIPSSEGASVYEFDVTGRHLRTVDSLTGVAVLTFSYDTSGRLTGITDRDGLVTTIVRNGAGVAQSIVSPFGVTTTLAINTDGFLQSVTDPEGHSVTLGYRDGGLLTSLLDANGGTHTFDYDTEGLLLRDEDAAGGAQVLSRESGSNGSTTTRTILDAGITTYITVQNPDGTQTRRVVAPDGAETVTTNLSDGSTVTTTADGSRITTTVGPDPRFGLAAPIIASTTVRTPAGLTMTTTRSLSVALANPEDPLSVVSHTETTRVNGRVWQSVFDAAERTMTSISPANRRVVTTHDALGRPTSTRVGTSTLPITFTYDAQGRPATRTHGVRTTTLEYDEHGYMAAVTDPLSRTVRYTNDRAGQMLLETRPDLREIALGYDDNGNLTSLTPPGRPAHTMGYTPVNLLHRYTAPTVDGPSTTQYQFNLAKHPTTVTRADGLQSTSSYDDAGRLETIDTPTGTTTFAYSPITGQLVGLTSPSGGLAYTYDGGLQTSESASGFTVGAVSWNYDASFRVTTERVNGANAISFGYDADGLLTSSGALGYIRRADDALVLTASLGGLVTTFTYSEFGELATEETRNGGTLIHRSVYTRDDGGRVSERSETIGGTTTSDVYGYDLAGRLTTVTRGGLPHAHYGYDAHGNRTTVTTDNTTVGATYDDQDRLVTFGDRVYTHTAHGEVRTWTDAGGTTTLTYDVHSNLLEVRLPSGELVDYVVDARNRRIGRRVNGVITHRWLYQGQQHPIAELDASGAVLSRFVYGVRASAPEYMIRGGITYRFVVDHLGSVRLVVNSATGSIAQRIDYDPWGRITLDSNPGFQPFGYAGGLADPLTGLVRFGLRDYDPVTGRWLSKDPISFDSGESNLYRYAFSDPINNVDFDGRIPVGAAIAVVGAVVGGVSEGLNAANAGKGAGDIALAAAQGAVAGAWGSLAAIGAAMVTGNPLAIGAAAGFVNEAVLQVLRRCLDATALAVSTGSGAVFAKYTSLLPDFTKRGVDPVYWVDRTLKELAKPNTVKLLRAEALGSSLAELAKFHTLNIIRGQ